MKKKLSEEAKPEAKKVRFNLYALKLRGYSWQEISTIGMSITFR
jgi:hypothetical protein